MEEKKVFYVDHHPQNEFHPETGIFLLWYYDQEIPNWDLVDWELYSSNAARGMTKIEAENKIIESGQRRGAKVELRKTI